MMKRVTWFVAGAAAGVGSSIYGKRKVRRTAQKLAPVNVARTQLQRVRRRSGEVLDAFRSGRSEREAELVALRDGTGTVIDVAPGRWGGRGL